MELRHAPIPSLRGWWGDVRSLLGLDAPRGEDGGDGPPAAERLQGRGAAPPSQARPWGAADRPELLAGLCEPATSLLDVLEELPPRGRAQD